MDRVFRRREAEAIAVDGGRPNVICDAPTGRGGTWSARGDIVFAPAAAGRTLTRLGERRRSGAGDDARSGCEGDRSPISTIPSGRRPFCSPRCRSAPASSTCPSARSAAARANRFAQLENVPVFAEPGYLLFLRKGVLVAQPFDPRARTLAGEPAPLGDVPASPTSGANYTAAHAASV